MEGTPLTDEVWNAISDGQDTLVAPVDELPELQPDSPPEGLLGEHTPLHLAFVPPLADSTTDMQSNYLLNVRRAGIGVSDVLRPGDAVDEIEAYNQTLAANTESADHITDQEAASITFHSVTQRDMPDGATEGDLFFLAPAETFYLLRGGILRHDTRSSDVGLNALVARVPQSGGTFAEYRENDRQARASPLVKIDGPETLFIGIENETGSRINTKVTATFSFLITNYDRSQVEGV